MKILHILAFFSLFIHSSVNARMCPEFFSNHLPRQQTQYYVSKDLLNYKIIREQFFEKLGKSSQQAHPETNGSVDWYNRQSKRTYNEFRQELHDYTLHRMKRQVQKIHEFRIYTALNKEQDKAIQHILKRLDVARDFLNNQPPSHKIKAPMNVAQVKKAYKRQALYQIRQYEFLTIYTHSMMHQFFEISSLRASHPLEGIPVSYMSTGWRHKEPFEIMWGMMNSTPKAHYEPPESGVWKGEVYIAETNKFIGDMEAYIAKTKKALHKFELQDQFSLRPLYKQLKTFRRKAEENNNKLLRDKATTEEIYIRGMTELANGLSGNVQSTLGEVWVLSRLPRIGEHFKANITGEEILGNMKTNGLSGSHYIKEFDIYSIFNVFGKKLHFAGEVKFYNKPLFPQDNKGYLKKLKRQILLSHQILKQFKNDEYELHFFLIRGVHIQVKNELEAMGVTVHGPVFQD